MRATEFITELNMAPGNLAAFLQTNTAANMRAGFEAELIFSELEGGNSPEDDAWINDYDQDQSVETNTSFDDIAEFFDLRPRDRDLDRLRSDYADFIEWEFNDFVSANIDSYIEKIQNDDSNLDPEDDADWIRRTAERSAREDFDRGHIPEVGELLLMNRVRYMSEVAEEYSLEWTKQKQAESTWTESAAEVGSTIENITSKNVNIVGSYHGQTKNNTDWYIEPDGSLNGSNDDHFAAEIVSPPMPVNVLIPTITEVLQTLRRRHGAYTNQSTGLHVGVSFAGASTDSLDYVKLVLFLGDQYVLEQFHRTANNYCSSALKNLSNRINATDNKSPALPIDQVFSQLKSGMVHNASKLVAAKNIVRTMSVNVKDNYVEFRSMGGDYINKLPIVENTILRYIRAYAVAMDPNAERQEYIKKLSKLLNPNNNDALQVFVNYVLGGRVDLEPVKTALVNRRAQSVQPVTQPNQTTGVNNAPV